MLQKNAPGAGRGLSIGYGAPALRLIRPVELPVLFQDDRLEREDVLGRGIDDHLAPVVVRAAEELDAGDVRRQTTVVLEHRFIDLELVWVAVDQQYLPGKFAGLFHQRIEEVGVTVVGVQLRQEVLLIAAVAQLEGEEDIRLDRNQGPRIAVGARKVSGCMD